MAELLRNTIVSMNVYMTAGIVDSAGCMVRFDEEVMEQPPTSEKQQEGSQRSMLSLKTFQQRCQGNDVHCCMQEASMY